MIQCPPTWSLGADDLLDHEAHGVSKVFAGLWKTPSIPFGTFGLRSIIALNDLLQTADNSIIKQSNPWRTLSPVHYPVMQGYSIKNMRGSGQ